MGHMTVICDIEVPFKIGLYLTLQYFCIERTWWMLFQKRVVFH